MADHAKFIQQLLDDQTLQTEKDFAKAAILLPNLPMSDAAKVGSEAFAARLASKQPKAEQGLGNLLNTSTLAGGLIAGGVGLTAANLLKDLLAGKSVTYPLSIGANNIMRVLKSKLSANNFSIGPDFDDKNIIVVLRKDARRSTVCRISLEPVEDSSTMVTFSGLNLGKSTNPDNLKSAVGQTVKKAVGSDDFLGSLFNSAAEAMGGMAETVVEGITDGGDINIMATAIDDYAHHLIEARQLAEKAAEEKIRQEEIKSEAEMAKIKQQAIEAATCHQCFGAHGNQNPCPNCGGNSGYIEPKN